MGESTICVNRKAHFNYEITERFEAGIMLAGSEVKSLRDGKGNVTDAYAVHRGGELFLLNLHISPYDPASQFNQEPTRSRKLLMHKIEIERLKAQIKEKGLTLIPLKLYFKAGKVKVELGLAKGKKTHDKREDIKKRDTQREISRSMKVNNRRDK